MQKLSEIADILANRSGQPARIAVVKAASDHVLDAIIPAVEHSWVSPILIDDKQAILELLADRLPVEALQIIDCPDPEQAAELGVSIIREKKAEILMKGSLTTGQFLKPVVNSQTGIRASDLLSHVAILEVPTLNRLVALTDGGMVLTPTKADLPTLIEHGRQVISKLGVENPKIALLSAAETIIPKLPSSVIQNEYVQEINDPNISGPISIDIALMPHIATEKGYTGAVQGDADILVTPDIVTGNTVAKSMIIFGGSKMAGIICGAQVPIVLTSRSASDEEKYFSIALASLVGGI